MVQLVATYLGLKVLAERTGRDYETLRAWCANKTIPAHRIAGEWVVSDALIPYIESLPKRRKRTRE